MNNLIRIQGKVVKVEPARTGYYVTIREQSSGKRQGAFSKWKLQEKAYVLTLRQDGKYFFIIHWQELATNLGRINNIELTQEKAIHQPYEARERQAEEQLIQKLQVKINQLGVEVQQWKNAYYNQKWMLKEAQRNAHQRTVKARIQAIENKPGKKSKQDLDYLNLLTEFSQECQRNWAWLGVD